MMVPGKSALDSADPVARLLASIANLRQEPKSKGAHLFRTSLRRFQAWTDVFHPRVTGEQKRALKYLEKLRKATGKLRDASIHLDLVDELRDVPAGEKRKLAKELRARRRTQKARLKALLARPTLASVWGTLELMSTGATPQGPAMQLPLPVPGLAEVAVASYRNYVARRAKFDAESLHDYRLECKRLRYTAELAGDSAEASAWVETWKQVQDAIGDWHDWFTLAEIADHTAGKSKLRNTVSARAEKLFNDAVKTVAAAEAKLVESAPRRSPKRAQGTTQQKRTA
jgi:CHAD domain-containing protein